MYIGFVAVIVGGTDKIPNKNSHIFSGVTY